MFADPPSQEKHLSSDATMLRVGIISIYFLDTPKTYCSC